MLAADTLEALDLKGKYVVQVNNRKLLDGVMQLIGIDLTSEEGKEMRLAVLRAIDKADRLGIDGVKQLLGAGRRDESGAFTKGVQLEPEKISVLMTLLAIRPQSGKIALDEPSPEEVDDYNKFGIDPLDPENFFSNASALLIIFWRYSLLWLSNI